MRELFVETKERKYPIIFSDSIEELGDSFKGITGSKKAVIVTDENVADCYLYNVQNILENAGVTTSHVVLMPGENNKNLKAVEKIYNHLLKERSDRNTCIAALGGGVTGDIAGFAAATYLRGLKFVQIPTTLLAQVDSSVGGKTGVDYNGYKNVIGAFYQPYMVYVYPGFLRTLPEREVINGIAEIIKHSLISDRDFFNELRKGIDLIKANNQEAIADILERNCSIKADIVRMDERENGIRAVLNLGHTFGHAIETLSGFEYTHGECVSIGIAGALYLSEKLGLIDSGEINGIIELLVYAGLPVKAEKLCINDIYNALFYDKKVRDQKLTFVLPVRAGEVVLKCINDENLIKEVLGKIIVA